MLSAASELRVLKLDMPADDTQMNIRSALVMLDALVGSHTWPGLRKLPISNVRTSEAIIVSFLMRRGATLRSLSLAYVAFTEGSWDSVFRTIAGQMPRLRRVRLHGTFKHIDHDRAPRHPDTVHYLSSVTSTFTASKECQILYGVNCTPSLNQLPDFCAEANPQSRYVQAREPQYGSDNTTVSYGPDEFDDCSPSDDLGYEAPPY